MAQLLYATLGNADPNAGALISIEPFVNTVTLIGPTNIVGEFGDLGVPAFAINSAGVAYALDIGNNSELYTVNLANGLATPVAFTGLRSPPAMAFDGNNILFVADIDRNLYTVDTATGAATLIGYSGVRIRGLAFDPLDGRLWASTNTDEIYTINPYTAAPTFVGNTGFLSCPDIDFFGGDLFGSDGGGVVTNRLIQINTATGVGTEIDADLGYRSVAGMGAQLVRASCPPGASVLYVSESATGAGTGFTWADAYTDLQSALQNGCIYVEEVWVSAGTYYPTSGVDRNATFTMRNGLAIYGGFAGNETTREERDPWVNTTTLSGEINNLSLATDNSYHVVTGNSVDPSAILDGFTVSDGYASVDGGGAILVDFSSTATLSNLNLKENYGANGGAILCQRSSSPSLANILFAGNTAAVNGGGMAMYSLCHPTFTNVAFSQNSSSNGGAMFISLGTASLTNVSIVDNVASSRGGGLYILSNGVVGNGLVTATNSIVWGNSASLGGSQIQYTSNAVTNFDHSLIEGSGGSGAWDPLSGADFGNNLDADPLFVDSPNGNLRLRSGSPAIDAGDDLATNLPAVDLDGGPRIRQGSVDMGAFEFIQVFVDATAAGAGDGTSWANAYPDLQDALAAVDYAEIWVAAGTYYPTSGADPAATIRLKSGVAIYGGFAGIETTMGERDPRLNTTILSGEINDPGTTVDNSYHVVSGDNTDVTAVLDGFTVTAGNAIGAPISQGGAIYLYPGQGSPTLSNLILTRNQAAYGGAVGCNTNCNPVLNNVVISQNTATGWGGAMSIFNSSSPTLINVVFWQNSTPSIGGAVYMGGTCNATVTNVTFAANDASQGGAIYVADLAPATTITNSIVWGNTGVASEEIYYAQTPTINIDHSMIGGSGGSSGWDSALGVDGGNNLDGNPLFADISSGNLRLSPGSPAIDAGDSTVVGLLATDLDGNPRLVGANVDLGAYELPDTGGQMAVAVGDLPGAAFIGAVYPNPFNPAVTVRFDLSGAREIRMRVFDLRGHVVRNLAKGRWPQGSHTLRWDGNDDAGRHMAAGVYFLRLEAAGWSTERKLVMVK